jgi:UDP-glucose 4-epimerase
MKNVLITGGCGFIGLRLLQSLNNLNMNLRILDNLSVGRSEDIENKLKINITASEKAIWDENIQLIVGDITDFETVNMCARGADVIIHLAANTGVQPSISDPIMDCNINVCGTLNTLEAARKNKCKKYIFASSGAPLGDQCPPLHEELVPKPVSPYGASKLSGEAYCRAYNKSFGLHTSMLRFSNVYGPGSKHKASVVSKFIQKILSQDGIEINGDGTQTRDFIYVDDLVRAINLAMLNSHSGIFQIATGIETSINALIEDLNFVCEGLGIKPPNYVNAESLVGDVKRNYSSIEKAKVILGWEPMVTLRDGLSKTMEYFIEERRKL